MECMILAKRLKNRISVILPKQCNNVTQLNSNIMGHINAPLTELRSKPAEMSSIGNGKTTITQNTIQAISFPKRLSKNLPFIMFTS